MSPGAAPHASIELIPDRCTSCMICARECPVWCIHIDAHTEVDPDAPSQQTGRGRRARTHNVLDGFVIDWSVCMFCGICVEECPFDALAWSADAVPPADLAGLRHGIERLERPATGLQNPMEP